MHKRTTLRLEKFCQVIDVYGVASRLQKSNTFVFCELFYLTTCTPLCKIDRNKILRYIYFSLKDAVIFTNAAKTVWEVVSFIQKYEFSFFRFVIMGRFVKL